MKIVEVKKLKESIRALQTFWNCGRIEIFQAIDIINSLATDDPWEAAARKLAEYLDASCPPIEECPNSLEDTSVDREKCIACWLAWAKGETK